MKSQGSHKLFEGRWKSREGVVITAGIWGCGLLLEISGLTPSVPSFPLNLILLALLVGIPAILHLNHAQTELVRWHSSMAGAIFTAGLFTFQTLMLGLIVQDPEASGTFAGLGFRHLTSSWPFALSLMWLLVSLGLTIAKRCTFRYTLRNTAFLLNHIGIWIILVSMAIGSGDLREMSFTAVKGRTLNHSGNGDPAAILPFSVTLLNFDILYYPPKIALYDPFSGNIPEKLKSLPFARENQPVSIGEWNITPLTVIRNGIPFEEQFVPAADSVKGGTAVYARAVNRKSNEIIEGWAYTGAAQVDPRDLTLGGQTALVVFSPEPQKYISSLRLEGANNDSETVNLEVNDPISFQGWTLYQSGYDTSKGKNSEISILFAIRDPWLPLVYTGIFMLFAGGLLMIRTGRPAVLNASKSHL